MRRTRPRVHGLVGPGPESTVRPISGWIRGLTVGTGNLDIRPACTQLVSGDFGHTGTGAQQKHAPAAARAKAGQFYGEISPGNLFTKAPAIEPGSKQQARPIWNSQVGGVQQILKFGIFPRKSNDFGIGSCDAGRPVVCNR